MSDERVRTGATRRGFLAGGVAAVGLGGVAGAASIAGESEVGDEGGPWLAGEFKGRTGSQSFEMEPAGSGTVVAVTLTDGAAVRHDSGGGLEAFKAGEEITVLAREEAADGSLIASRLEIMFRVVDGSVIDRKGDVLHTSDGDLALSSNARPQASEGWAGEHFEATPLAEIEAGDHVVARVTRQARSKALRVFRIGEKAS